MMRRRGLLKAGAALAALSGCGRSGTNIDVRTQEPWAMDATDLAAAIRAKELSAVDAVEMFARRIEKIEPSLGAFTHLDIDGALDRARAVDPSRPFAGVPFAIKDLYDYPGMPWRYGSALFREHRGGGKSPYTEKLEAAGLVAMGKTTTPEFGLLPTTEPLAFEPTVNPWNAAHSCGGSSGGAAAAVAARLLPLAYASDGGGSIRIPAAACGVFGLKCTRGRFSGQGEPKLAIPLSIHHPHTRSVRDSAAILALTETPQERLAPVGHVGPQRLAPLKVALSVNNALGRRADADVAAAVERCGRRLEEMGHLIEVVEATPLQSEGFPEAFTALWASGAFGIYQVATELAGVKPEESGLLEPFTIGLAELFRSTSEAAFAAGIARIQAVEADVDRWFGRYDAWLTPVVGTVTPKLGFLAGGVPFTELMARLADYVGYTPLHNACGTPAAAIPFGKSAEGLPIGVQIAAGKGREDLLLKVAYALEESDPWARELPAAAIV
ncbi:MAG: 6-aminohexanoate hydrolase [Parvularculaceae bacterium]|nr:6-aminohexanoate hydrolase [Parvularculaceae bacterium]